MRIEEYDEPPKCQKTEPSVDANITTDLGDELGEAHPEFFLVHRIGRVGDDE